MPIVLVKNLHCDGPDCDRPTPLLASTLEEKLEYRSDSPTYGIQVFFACPHCKLVGQSSIPVQSERLEIAEGQQHPDDIAPFRVLLECAQQGCEALIEVLGTKKTGKSNSQARDVCRTWKFGVEVMCAKRKRPARPLRIVDLVLGD